MRVAVLDLGSTSFRLVVADWELDTGLVPHVRRRERLNLGLVVGREGRIPEPHATAAVRAVAKLRRRAEVSGAMPVVAVATSALRDARNGEKVVRRIAAAAGVPVRILSGDEEAALTSTHCRPGCRSGPLNGLHLPAEAVEDLSRRILSSGGAQCRRMPGMDQHRADVLGAGTLVVALLLRRFGYAGITVSELGLREGVILEAVDLALQESAAAV